MENKDLGDILKQLLRDFEDFFDKSPEKSGGAIKRN